MSQNETPAKPSFFKTVAAWGALFSSDKKKLAAIKANFNAAEGAFTPTPAGSRLTTDASMGGDQAVPVVDVPKTEVEAF